MGLPLIMSGSQDWLGESNIIKFVDNGCGVHDFPLDLQAQQWQKLQQQKNQFLVFPYSFSTTFPTTTTATTTTAATSASTILNNSTADAAGTGTGHDNNDVFPSSLFQSLASQLENQRQEIDAYIFLQNEIVRIALQEQSKMQLACLMSKLEAKATILLRQKDEEIAHGKMRSLDLRELAKRLEIEKQLWMKAVAENEAIISSLNTTIQQLRQSKADRLAEEEDAESCCNVTRIGGRKVYGEEVEEEEGSLGRRMAVVCGGCNARKSSVLFLPCRHLCSCKDCEAFLRNCPVCKSVKHAAIEVLSIDLA